MNKRNNNFNGKMGTSVKMLKAKLTPRKSKKSKMDFKSSFKSGKCKNPDLMSISIGFSALSQIIERGIDTFESNIVNEIHEKDISQFQFNLINSKNSIRSSLRRISDEIRAEQELRNHLSELREDYRLAQAARDGILIKQEKRIEKLPNGEKKEIIYDTSMTKREVIDTLNRYDMMVNRLKTDRVNDYISLGMNTIGLVGIIYESKSFSNNKSISVISLSTLVTTAINLLERSIPNKNLEEARRLNNKDRDHTFDFLDNEQLSYKAEEDAYLEIENYARESKKLYSKNNNRNYAVNMSLNIIVALVTGMIINDQVTKTPEGKLDSKVLASTLRGLSETKGHLRDIIHIIENILDNKDRNEDVKNLYKKVKDIKTQMEEKVYPLKGASNSFDSFEITNFEGKFYPTKNYETNEITYNTIIKIPEFSMKKGDVVLLSGDSGTGKSTFLRLLKRGDINNQGVIKIDGKENVDSLGKEYISFRPSTNLGNESNVLNQITSKESISELTEEEKENLLKIMKELNLDFTVDILASRKFMEFSTGQQRRLALAKVFYRIKDSTSVVIVDEPVGNVEDELIREQLKMIKDYALKNDLMLILVTHRMNLAEDLVTKRYHISNDGLMELVPIEKKTLDEEKIPEME